MTHEDCSELLHAHLRGELAGDTADAVSTHLEGCEECRAELAGLAALMAERPEGLRREERDRLHEGVAAGLAPRPGRAADVLPFERRARAPWGVRWLGAAAAVLVIAVGGAFALNLFDGESTDLGTADSGAGGGAGGEEAAPTQDVDGPTPRFVSDLSALQFALTAGADDQNDLAAQEDAGETYSRSRLADSPRSLSRLARTSSLFAAFARAYEPAEAEDLADTFIVDLAEQAPPEAAAQIEECGRMTLDAATTPILPVFATRARYLGDEALILGYITGDSALDRYTVWVWPAGSCERPLDSVFGRVRG
jgi:hypothetical protein